MLFSDPDKGGGGEGGKQAAARERCFSLHCTWCFYSHVSSDVLITQYMYDLDVSTRHYFSISAAAQKAGLDRAGTPRDVRKFGKAAL